MNANINIITRCKYIVEHVIPAVAQICNKFNIFIKQYGKAKIYADDIFNQTQTEKIDTTDVLEIQQHLVDIEYMRLMNYIFINTYTHEFVNGVYNTLRDEYIKVSDGLYITDVFKPLRISFAAIYEQRKKLNDATNKETLTQSEHIFVECLATINMSRQLINVMKKSKPLDGFTVTTNKFDQYTPMSKDNITETELINWEYMYAYMCDQLKTQAQYIETCVNKFVQYKIYAPSSYATIDNPDINHVITSIDSEI